MQHGHHHQGDMVNSDVPQFHCVESRIHKSYQISSATKDFIISDVIQISSSDSHLFLISWMTFLTTTSPTTQCNHLFKFSTYKNKKSCNIWNCAFMWKGCINPSTSLKIWATIDNPLIHEQFGSKYLKKNLDHCKPLKI